MKEAEMIKSIISGIGKPDGGKVYIQDLNNTRKDAINIGYDGNGDVIIMFNGEFK